MIVSNARTAVLYVPAPGARVARRAAAAASMDATGAARAATDRPGLFAAVVSDAGWRNALHCNSLRYVAEPNGRLGRARWSSLDDRAGDLAPNGVDSCQADADGCASPRRCSLPACRPRGGRRSTRRRWRRLLAASASGKPALPRVDFEADYCMGSTRAQLDEEAADTDAFIAARTRKNDRERD